MRALRTFVLGITLAAGLTGAALLAQPSTPPPTGNNGAGDLTGWYQTQQTLAGLGQRWQTQSQSAELARQYVKAEKEEEKRELRKKLSDLLGQQFDQHSKKQEKELQDIEKQIASLKAVLKKRLDAKTTIVERRLDQLLQDAEGLGWNAPPFPAQSGDSMHLFAPIQPFPPTNKSIPKKE